jgi:type IV pilus assembly protein PilE
LNARTCKPSIPAQQYGFTLLEVVIVMAMLGILAAIAIPNYTEYVRRGHRAAAQEHLISLAARQAQFYVDRREFAASVDDLNLSTPRELANRYSFAIVTAGPPAVFTIVATPTGSQLGDRCGDMAIDQTGRRGVRIDGSIAVPPQTIAAVGNAPTGCW